MKLLIDGDVVAFRCAASSENDPDWIATSRIDKMLDDLFRACNESDCRIFLTGKNNFRKELDPEYKANRKDKPKPKWLQLARDFLVGEYNAEVVDGYEADDALAMHQTEETIICSNDKDLLQIPGEHFNFIRGEFVTVSPLQGIRSFYRGLLIGDTSDNIRGVDGIGPVKAGKLIDPLEEEREMFLTCLDKYQDNERLLRNGKLMWLWRFEKDIWQNSDQLFSLLDSTIQQEVEPEQEY